MVEFRDMWFGHPINESVQTPCVADESGSFHGVTVRKGYPVYANQCAIRLGIALKRAGVTRGQMTGCLTCGAHDPDFMHFIRAQEVADALARSSIPGIGATERLRGSEPKEFYPQLFGRTGIIFIKDYWHRSTDRQDYPTGDHVDVWNGYRSSAKWLMEWFSWLGYYSNYAQAREIWFWPVE